MGFAKGPGEALAANGGRKVGEVPPQSRYGYGHAGKRPGLFISRISCTPVPAINLAKRPKLGKNVTLYFEKWEHEGRGRDRQRGAG